MSLTQNAWLAIPKNRRLPETSCEHKGPIYPDPSKDCSKGLGFPVGDLFFMWFAMAKPHRTAHPFLSAQQFRDDSGMTPQCLIQQSL